MSNMINYKKIGVTFSVRSAGILIKNEKVLVHKLRHDPYWTIPGGKVDINEKSEDTLVREFNEELSANIKTERLLWIVESFFEYKNTRFHEISFIYLISELENSGIPQEDFEAIEGSKLYLFKWVDFKNLSRIKLKPEFLAKRISDLPSSIEHIKYEH